jgi:sterol desaturase/sphingolipid hydroxylase (fatty acid hydroxylase superfamily)
VTAAARSEARRDLVSGTPTGYSPRVHLAVTTFVALAAIAGSLVMLRGVEAWQLAAVPVFLLAANAVEWHAHRGLLHRHAPFADRVYRAHAQHHRLFAADDMAVRDAREMGLVILPWEAFQLALAVALPVALALAAAGQPNLAALWVASAAAHVVACEWLHLAYHLPPGRETRWVPFLGAMRRRHALHHSPRQQRYNLNVTAPLWDLVRGTLVTPARRALDTRAGVG